MQRRNKNIRKSCDEIDYLITNSQLPDFVINDIKDITKRIKRTTWRGQDKKDNIWEKLTHDQPWLFEHLRKTPTEKFLPPNQHSTVDKIKSFMEKKFTKKQLEKKYPEIHIPNPNDL